MFLCYVSHFLILFYVFTLFSRAILLYFLSSLSCEAQMNLINVWFNCVVRPPPSSRYLSGWRGPCLWGQQALILRLPFRVAEPVTSYFITVWSSVLWNAGPVAGRHTMRIVCQWSPWREWMMGTLSTVQRLPQGSIFSLFLFLLRCKL